MDRNNIYRFVKHAKIRIKENKDSDPKFQKKSNKPRIIAVTSGKGGVGKSHFVVNLAINLQKYGKKVLIIDADLGLANIDVLLGVRPKFNMYHVMKGARELKDIVYNCEEYNGVKLIAGASGIQEIADLDESHVSDFLSGFDDLEGEADYILVDTGAGITKNVVSFLLSAENIIVVTTPEPTALTDAYGIIKVVGQHTNNESNIGLVINRVLDVAEARKVSDKLNLVTRQFLNMSIENIGFIYDDTVVSKAVRQQIPFSILEPYSNAAKCMNNITAKILNLPEEDILGIDVNKGSLRGFFSKALNFFK
ncbi:MinD/ParA family protein [bacterium]|nr:MinD/ParA family protein [bacterium]